MIQKEPKKDIYSWNICLLYLSEVNRGGSLKLWSQWRELGRAHFWCAVHQTGRQGINERLRFLLCDALQPLRTDSWSRPQILARAPVTSLPAFLQAEGSQKVGLCSLQGFYIPKSQHKVCPTVDDCRGPWGYTEGRPPDKWLCWGDLLNPSCQLLYTPMALCIFPLFHLIKKESTVVLAVGSLLFSLAHSYWKSPRSSQ